MKLDAKAFAITCALVWGFGLLCLTWWIILWDGASTAPNFLSQLYRGYRVSPMGSLIGLAWALPDGFLGGLVFAWLYNGLSARARRRA